MEYQHYVNLFLFINNVFQKHIQSPPWEDWKGGLGGLPKTLYRTVRGVIEINASINYLSNNHSNK